MANRSFEPTSLGRRRYTAQLQHWILMDPFPRTGWFLTLNIFGLPVFLHWSLPALGSVAGLLALAASGSLSPAIFMWSSLTCAALVVFHELGHLVAAKALSLQVHGIVLAGNGGCCIASEPTTLSAKLIFFSGGLFAQALVFVMTAAWLWKFGAPSYQPLNCAVIVLTGVNLLIMLGNMVPRGANDGAQIVKLAREALRRNKSDLAEK